jgi:hypothetical protein
MSKSTFGLILALVVIRVVEEDRRAERQHMPKCRRVAVD